LPLPGRAAKPFLFSHFPSCLTDTVEGTAVVWMEGVLPRGTMT
jgi:hypothetical protein